MKLAIFFIVEGRTLELQSLLLADSLRIHHDTDVQCIAYVPTSYISSMDPLTVDFLRSRDVDIVPFHTPRGTWRRPYPHGNKLLAAAQHRECDYSIFLDTDTCCFDSVIPPIESGDARVFAVPEGVATWGGKRNSTDWQTAYKYFRLPLPEDRVRLVRGKQREFFPYFNAGYVAFPERHPETNDRFGNLWLQTAVALDFGAKIPKKRPWLDQISLPIAMKRFGYSFCALDDTFNFSTKAREPDGEAIKLAHYHRDAGFLSWPTGAEIFQSFSWSMRSYPQGSELLKDEATFLGAMTGQR